MSGEKKLSNINFFICSTYTDLQPYREAVIKKIRSKAGVINAQEFFGARDQKPLKTCLEEIRKSNIFILIVGMRYGTVIRNRDKSYVECEYEEAKKLKLPIFAYIIDESYPIPPTNVDRFENAERLDKFKKAVLDDFTVDKFTTPEDLSDKVLKDLVRELPKKGYSINEGAVKLEEQKIDLVDLISRFKTLPKIHYGKEFSIKVKLGNFERASKGECEALSLTYGASTKREITATDEKIDNLLDSELKVVYAEYELAQRLLDYGFDSEVELKVKTIQGISRTRTPIYRERPNAYLTSVFARPERFIVDYETKEELLIGLELLDIVS